jgi:hypothetical protein
MATQTALLASEAWDLLRVGIRTYKNNSQVALTNLQSGPITSDYIFTMLDQLRGAIASLTTYKAVSGLDTYATQQGYPGTYTVDITINIADLQACLDWIAANFPASGGWLQASSLNADGSRTPRSFSTAQTAGLQTALTTLIASIG